MPDTNLPAHKLLLHAQPKKKYWCIIDCKQCIICSEEWQFKLGAGNIVDFKQ